MTAGRIINTWRGAGNTYERFSPVMEANETSRWMPFRDKGMQRSVMAPGAQNKSGEAWEKHHAGIKSAAISDNIGKM